MSTYELLLFKLLQMQLQYLETLFPVASSMLHFDVGPGNAGHSALVCNRKLVCVCMHAYMQTEYDLENHKVTDKI